MEQAKKLTGAVVGAGFMGQTHINGYNTLDSVDLKAVIDPAEDRARRAAEPFGIHWYATIEEAAKNHSLDFIDICAPTPSHVEMTEAAFKQGCHVLVEKPVTANVTELKKMKQLVKSNDKRFMVAHVCRFMPAYLHAKHVVSTGRLGKPLAFSARRYLVQPEWSLHDWINDREKSGGTIVDLSIHDIDIANWFLGKPKHVYGSEITKVPKGPSHVLETLEYENNCVAHVEASHLLPKGYPLTSEFQLVLENGFLSSATNSSGTYLWEFSDETWKELSLSRFVTWDDPYTEELHHFVSSIHNGTEFRISFDDAEKALLAALSLKNSVAAGEGNDVIAV